MDVADQYATQSQVKDEVGVRCQKLFQDFLEEFKEDNEIKYEKAAKDLIKPELSTLEVSFDDVEKYNQNLATTIIEEYYRIYPFLNLAIINYVRSLADSGMKKELQDKECYVSFVDVPTRHKVRELTTAKIGTLIRITGQIVRTHPVHPELVLGTFVCLDCQTVIKNVEQQFKYTLPTICRNPVCANRRRFMLDTDKSVFVDFQKVRIQETQAELPRGCIPRSLEVILRAEAVESVQAGDRYDFTGSLIVVPDVGALSLPGSKAELTTRTRQGNDGQMEGIKGLKALGVRELHYKTAFLACSVQAVSRRFGAAEFATDDLTTEDMRKQMTDKEWDKIYEMSRDRNLYNNLIASLFPSIHGNNEVKRGVLLMLFGGVAKTTIEATTLRGDLNVCIVGDPSTAKSQLLKQVSEITPRALYTSGKGSSAAGLTAAVVKDEESFDFVIEAGALMLADGGVCCIDEFDKMDLADQVAIHEAMEQQTISIAKAGVRATLNARTSILAAANPVGGRYDRAKSLQQNVNLSAPIMSRFDLFFILIDESSEMVDYAIARKIVDLHCNKEETYDCVYTREDLLRYIAFARSFKPIITEEAGELLVEYYCSLRARDGSAPGSWRITVRQLESMVRLAEAMAKMHCSGHVTPQHVNEAYRLLNKSIIRVEQPDIHLDEDEPQLDPTMDVDEDLPSGTNGTTNGSTNGTQNGHSGDSAAKKKLTLSFEEYRALSDMLVVHMRREEAEQETQGARVIMACRSIERAEQAKKEIEEKCKNLPDTGTLVVEQCILSSLKSVREFAQKMLDNEPEINILVNNAGIMMDVREETEDGYEMQFATNHLAHFLLTLLLLPRMANSKPARIVTVSSMGHTRTPHFNDWNFIERPYSTFEAYSQSKLSNILFSRELAKKLKENNIEGINTYSLHPGAVSTDITRNWIKGWMTIPVKISGFFAKPFVKTPELGAQTNIYCAVDEKCAKETGLYYSDCVPVTPSVHARDDKLAEELWDLSAKLVGIGNYNPFTAADAGSESSGMRKSAVVSWYLEQLVGRGDIESEDELLERKTLVEKVIDRLMYHDQVIIPLSTTGLKASQKSDQESEDDPLLVVHPNYVVDT